MRKKPNISVRRRDVLRTIGAGAVVGASALPAGAKTTRHVVGTKNQKGQGKAKQLAKSVHRELDFGAAGKAVAGRFPEQARKALEKNPNVRYIEPDGRMEAVGQSLPWGVDRVDSDETTADGSVGNGAHIAIVDSGIDSDHPDLQANLGAGAAFVSCGSCEEPWDDDNNHGTHCAGIAGAVDNSQAVVGIAPAATLHAVKVLGSSGWGSYSDIAAGIQHVADQGWDVASLSLGGSSDSYSVSDAIEYATDQGVLCVAAAGNSGPCTDCVLFPARHPDVVAVTATDGGDDLASFSCTGPEVDITAPGVYINSTIVGGTASFSGTSMACPHVSGAAGVLMANGYSNTEARARLEETAEDIGLSSNEQGKGLLDVEGAVSGGGDSSPSVSVVSPSDGSTVSGTVTVQVDASDAEDSAGSLSVEVSIDGGAWNTASYSSSSGLYEYGWDTTSVPDGEHTTAVQATDSGGSSSSDAVTLTTDNTDPGFVEQDGSVVLEAEQFTASAPGVGSASESDWSRFDDADAGGGVAMEATPNEGVNVGDTTDGPRLDYEIEFSTPGTYHVWTRLQAPSGTDDSIHVGFDGQPLSYGKWGVANNSDWAWVDTAAGSRLTFEITSSGTHTVSIWMREDGVQADQLLLTTDSNYVPTGTDPSVGDSTGPIVFDAEEYTGLQSGAGTASSSTWAEFSDSNASNGVGMEAVPNEGVNVGDTTDGPRLDYAVELEPETYYVWIRMQSDSGTDDSVHVGLNGQPVSYGKWGVANNGTWTWVNTAAGSRLTVDAASSGTHTVNVWMREDGVQVDKLLLTTDSDYTPSGKHPTA